MGAIALCVLMLHFLPKHESIMSHALNILTSISLQSQTSPEARLPYPVLCLRILLVNH